MKDLVFINQAGSRAEPYTTSGIISNGSGVSEKKIREAIRKYSTELERFGLLASYQAESNGGRPRKVYMLNEPQSAFLLTLLKNTPAVVEFKSELVRQFFLMREELAHRKMLRAEGKSKRRSLTDAIRDSGEQERMKGHAFTAYTNLAYKATLGQNASQLRKARGADRKAVAADFLTADELTCYQKQEAAITALLDIGMNYDDIKAALLKGG